MQTIAVLNQKGGAGKTTLATNLAAAAHLLGMRTLLVDMDEQGSSLDWGARRADDTSKLATLAVVKADRALTFPKLQAIGQGYELVVLDGPPRLGDVTRAAACAADVVVLPIQPGPFDLWSVGDTLKLLDAADSIRLQLERPPLRRLFALNRATAGTLITRMAEGAIGQAGEITSVIHHRVAFPVAASHGESVLTYEPDGAAAHEIRRLFRAVRHTAGAA